MTRGNSLNNRSESGHYLQTPQPTHSSPNQTHVHPFTTHLDTRYPAAAASSSTPINLCTKTMDFGRQMQSVPGIIAKSNIRLVDETHLGADDALDRAVCKSSNVAAMDLFLGNDNPSVPPARRDANQENGACESGNDSSTSLLQEKQLLVNCDLYNERHLPPPRSTIQPTDLVVIFESFNDINFVYATPNDIFSNRNGHFHHNDFIGKPYGCKIRSRNNDGLGFLYLLRPTPELWARSLPHRTQIVHELDAAMIVHHLNVSPNMIVCESGTGSGAMSHVFLRSLAPMGKLHTYEFNKVRVEKARDEFVGHGLGHLVEVHHRDVCGKKALLKLNGEECCGVSGEEKETADKAEEANKSSEDDGKGGFQLGQSVAHAIFLDLPEPWLAVPHAAHTIKPNGRICSYSPCMEQTQRTCTALRQHGFHSIQTVEARLKEYFVDEFEREAPPTDLPVIPTEETASLEKERHVNGGEVVGPKKEKEDTEPKQPKKRRKKGLSDGSSGNKILCARPFAQMRGHTAFLTFATAGNALRPDPNVTS
eukprot:scaffold128_cov198-Alexandrium_tamarense.AAC.8